MARYTGPKDKKSRRVRTKLWLKGERDASPKSGFARRSYPPGQHGAKQRSVRSEFGAQLLEKQKVQWMYGIMERQFRRYVEEARKHKGVTDEMLVRRLERRLDNVVLRIGFALSRSAARQLVSHGHITVNRKKIAIPSYAVEMGDVVGIREASRAKKVFSDLATRLKKYEPPSWLRLHAEKTEGEVIGMPTVGEAGIPADIQRVVEFYSR